MTAPAPCVLAVCLDRRHAFSKPPAEVILLRAGWGVEGDALAGVTVQHRSRKRWAPTLPNLRQVHLLHAELHDELAAAGYSVGPGDLGEDVTTRGLDLLGLPVGTVLRLGADGRDPDGNVVRKTGVMGVVLADGEVRPGDAIGVELPAEPHRPLAPV